MLITWQTNFSISVSTKHGRHESCLVPVPNWPWLFLPPGEGGGGSDSGVAPPNDRFIGNLERKARGERKNNADAHSYHQPL